MSLEYDCIVLGAGISGVTAARNLQEQGLKVCLLEGADRIGGRMYALTDFIHHPKFAEKGFHVEAGAEYVHVSREPDTGGGGSGAPEGYKRYGEFFQELDRLGLKTRRFPKWGKPVVEPGCNRLAFTGRGLEPKPLIPAILHNCRLFAVEEIFDEIRELDVDMPAGEFAREQHYDGGRAEALGYYAVSSHAPGVLDLEAGEDNLSVLGLKQDHIPRQLEDPAEHRLNDGAGRLLPYAPRPGMIESEFRWRGGETFLRRRVESVRRADGGVEVIARTAPGGAEAAFKARAAVCTFSVGMLARNGRGIFGELFHEEKLKALEVIKMGPITKFMVEFRERFWDKEMTVLSSPQGGARTFFSAFPGVDGPHVLTGLFMGRDHKLVSALNQEDALRWVFREIEQIFNPEQKDGPWKMEEMIVRYEEGGRSRWSFHRQEWSDRAEPWCDEFALGGNSFVSYGDDPPMTPRQAREALKSPLGSLPVFWAGEATAPAYHKDYQPLAVHGAYVSGVRVAEDVHTYLSQGEAEFRRRYAEKYRDLG
ncbi:MAG: flavin monoamine oxidase family protein, partial [Thermoanaerobaculia bacterium]